MKKVVLALVAYCSLATMFACTPVESHVSTSATYLYTLRAEFGKNGAEIGVPTLANAVVSVDSLLLAYSVDQKFGGTRYFAATGANSAEMQIMLYGLIKKSFDSLVVAARATDVDKLLDSCTYIGGSARIVFEVIQVGYNAAIIADTIVEKHRFNFIPSAQSPWTTTDQNERYSTYVFDKNNVVVLLHAGGDEPSTYTIDPLTGILTVAAIPEVPEHTLTFKTQNGKQCFVSSANDATYFLDIDK